MSLRKQIFIMLIAGCTAVVAALVAVAYSQNVPYDRDLYRHWVDADRDCQDTRQEVLIAESTIPVTTNRNGCRVLSGQWMDPYTGQTFTDPGDLDIDHLVPLAEAHRSGGNLWSAERRQAYANDLQHSRALIAVDASANRSKGDRDPNDWMPANIPYWCQYLEDWVVVKTMWGLNMDTAEHQFVQQQLFACER